MKLLELLEYMDRDETIILVSHVGDVRFKIFEGYVDTLKDSVLFNYKSDVEKVTTDFQMNYIKIEVDLHGLSDTQIDGIIQNIKKHNFKYESEAIFEHVSIDEMREEWGV